MENGGQAMPLPSDLTDSQTHDTSISSTVPLRSLRPELYEGDPIPSVHDGEVDRRHESRFHEATYRLTPSLYSLNMGTGVVSILLYTFPYPAYWLRILGIIFFAFNIVLFLVISVATIIRYARWKGLFQAVIRHGTTGLFWGCMPMGFATIVNMVALVLAPINHSWAKLALGLWWIDALVSVFVNLGMIFMMFTRQTHTFASVSSNWLLPVVASVVTAASGGLVAASLSPYDPSLARSTAIVSYIIWGTGIPLALSLIPLIIARSTILGLPQPSLLASIFLPLGPCGQGSFGILILGRTIRNLSSEYNTPFAIGGSGEADVAYGFGILVGLILWGFGFCWYILGHAVVLDYVIRKDQAFLGVGQFSVGMWAITFPLGVFTTATYQLAIDLDSQAFRVIGAFQAVQVTIYWIYVTILTGWKFWDRTLFVAPELEGYVEEKRFGSRQRNRDSGV